MRALGAGRALGEVWELWELESSFWARFGSSGSIEQLMAQLIAQTIAQLIAQLITKRAGCLTALVVRVGPLKKTLTRGEGGLC